MIRTIFLVSQATNGFSPDLHKTYFKVQRHEDTKVARFLPFYCFSTLIVIYREKSKCGVKCVVILTPNLLLPTMMSDIDPLKKNKIKKKHTAKLDPKC